MKYWKPTLVSMALVLTGCSDKGPSCGDQSSLDDIRQILKESITNNRSHDNGAEAMSFGFRQPRAGTEDAMAAYISSISVDFAPIVSDGYDKNAKLQSCHATAKINVGDKSFSGTVSYTIQKTESPQSPLEVRVQDPGDFVVPVIGAVFTYYESQLKQLEAKAAEAKKAAEAVPAPNQDVASDAGKSFSLIGLVKAGSNDSVIESDTGDSVSFLTASDIGKRILSVCQDGDRCSIRGIRSDGWIKSIEYAAKS